MCLYYKLLVSWSVHDYSHPDKRYNSSNYIIPVRNKPVHFPPPNYRHDDKNSAIGSIYSPKISWLPCCHNSIQYKSYPANCPKPPRFISPEPLPNKVATPNFTKPG